MELLPDDLRRIVFAFSAPTVGARQLAARARTLDEFVEYSRLDMDAILRPLSLAVPELRILMHPEDEGRTPKGASMRCWHARCGHDWTDPVFY